MRFLRARRTASSACARRARLAALVVLALALADPGAVAAQSVPHPRDVLGHEVGADRLLADWRQIGDYFTRLAASPAVRVDTLGLTTAGQPFLAVNGVQTQSAATYCLAGELPALAAAGVDIVRVSPQAHDTVRVLESWRGLCDGVLEARAGRKALGALSPGALANGFWHGRAGHLLA